jgi:hypothetical protein
MDEEHNMFDNIRKRNLKISKIEFRNGKFLTFEVYQTINTSKSNTPLGQNVPPN